VAERGSRIATGRLATEEGRTMRRLEGKTCIVTGAAHGIGKAIAQRLATEGASVVIGDIDLDTAVAVAVDIDASGGRAFGCHVDVTQRQSLTELISVTAERYGDLHVMFNNAGVAQAVPILDTTEEQWERLMRINALGVLLGTQESAKRFIEQGSGGKIVNTASVAGKQGFALVGAYSASKFAVVGLTQAAARELASHGITVNGFCPGIVATDLWRKLDEQIMHTGRTSEVGEAMAQFGEDILLGRVSVPEDSAGIAAYLASTDSDYMTGQCIQVDGGMILQ
jgi:meso-butanediol dehydrogenase/(S,S)-butanediol dehydrogenase/diacetyl reductase